MPNRLSAEKSPYLLQHAGNPVDWYPWGEAAFSLARSEQKPIFLSVGYSTCHWCHVMEHESFEDLSIAALLNREFVSIKVDREERPDVDRVYMAFVQATTGSGGWPMSVWLTPDLEPFYGGTYFPPASRWNRPGFGDLLAEISRAWREKGDGVRRSAATITAQLRQMAAGSGRPGTVPGAAALESAVGEYARAFDARRGGFGQAPKFPRPSELLFLLREAVRTGQTHPRTMVERTLQAMALGGLRDHVGGGFHRYSVDADWRVPHFEKMLYDQAQLAVAYLEVFQATGDGAYADVADDTLAYVAREMTAPGGGFYSAEDADSVPPGAGPSNHEPSHPPARKTEGAFYLWTDEEVGRLLGEDADLVRQRFGIEPDGNAPFDPHNEFGRGNLLYVAKDLGDLAASTGLSACTIAGKLDDARQQMLTARAMRPRPHLDDKVLTAWNGLMLGAFARGARVLGLEAHLEIAERAASFVRRHLWDATTGTLLRRYREGDAAIPGYADDYANLIWGLLELFQAGGQAEWLAWALELQQRQDTLFWDTASGGWYSTSGNDASVLVRLKEDYDGAEPSACSVGALNLLTLAHLTGDRHWHARAEQVLQAFAGRLEASGRAMPLMMTALSAHHQGLQQLVVVGPRDDARTAALVNIAAQAYLPFAVVVVIEPGTAQQHLARVSPSLGAMTMLDGRPTAYWCHNFTCEAPTTDPDVLRLSLGLPM